MQRRKQSASGTSCSSIDLFIKHPRLYQTSEATFPQPVWKWRFLCCLFSRLTKDYILQHCKLQTAITRAVVVYKAQAGHFLFTRIPDKDLQSLKEDLLVDIALMNKGTESFVMECCHGLGALWLRVLQDLAVNLFSVFLDC